MTFRDTTATITNDTYRPSSTNVGLEGRIYNTPAVSSLDRLLSSLDRLSYTMIMKPIFGVRYGTITKVIDQELTHNCDPNVDGFGKLPQIAEITDNYDGEIFKREVTKLLLREKKEEIPYKIQRLGPYGGIITSIIYKKQKTMKFAYERVEVGQQWP